MSLVDSKTYLADGGWIQKGPEGAIHESDLSNEVQDLLPSRWYRDDKIFQLERRAIFSRVNMLFAVSKISNLTEVLLGLAHRFLRGPLSEGGGLSDL